MLPVAATPLLYGFAAWMSLMRWTAYNSIFFVTLTTAHECCRYRGPNPSPNPDEQARRPGVSLAQLGGGCSWQIRPGDPMKRGFQCWQGTPAAASAGRTLSVALHPLCTPLFPSADLAMTRPAACPVCAWFCAAGDGLCAAPETAGARSQGTAVGNHRGSSHPACHHPGKG